MKIKRAGPDTYSITLRYERQGELALTAKEAGFYAGLMALAKDNPSVREQLEWNAFHVDEISTKDYLMFVNIAWSTF